GASGSDLAQAVTKNWMADVLMLRPGLPVVSSFPTCFISCFRLFRERNNRYSLSSLLSRCSPFPAPPRRNGRYRQRPNSRLSALRDLYPGLSPRSFPGEQLMQHVLKEGNMLVRLLKPARHWIVPVSALLLVSLGVSSAWGQGRCCPPVYQQFPQYQQCPTP